MTMPDRIWANPNFMWATDEMLEFHQKEKLSGWFVEYIYRYGSTAKAISLESGLTEDMIAKIIESTKERLEAGERPTWHACLYECLLDIRNGNFH